MKERQHPYCYPNSDVLRNKLDIRDRRELEAAERLLSATRLRSASYDHQISPAGLKAIHLHLFEPLYEWAGKYRGSPREGVV